MATVTVNGNTIDPEAPNNVAPDAGDSNFILIQGHHDLIPEEKSQLASMAVDIQEYVAEYTYLCRYEPKNLESIRALPFVRNANV